MSPGDIRLGSNLWQDIVLIQNNSNIDTTIS